MSKLTTAAALALVTASAGCGVTLSEAGKRVQIMKADPPQGCKEVGPVSSGRAPAEDAKADLRNKGAELGADYVRLETVVDATYNATAYKCPPGTPMPSGP